MNGLKKFFGKNDIEVFESGRKSAEQAKQKDRKPKSSRWKKYLAVGASLAILGFATPLNSGENDAHISPDNIKSNKIELASNVTVEKGSAVQDNTQGEFSYFIKAKEMEEKFNKTKEGKKLGRKISSSIGFMEERVITESGIKRMKDQKDAALEYVYIAYLCMPYIYQDSTVENDAGHELLKFAISKGVKIRMHFPENGEAFSGLTEYLPVLDRKGIPKKGEDGKEIKEPVITLSWPSDFRFPDEIKGGKNIFDTYELFPDKKQTYNIMRALGHELRHLWQIENGMPLVENTDHLHDQIMKKRIREADATAIETLITWQMNKKFKNEEPFNYYMQDGVKGDIALQFKKAKEGALDLDDKDAVSNAFLDWYGNENRNRPYDEQIVKGWTSVSYPEASFKPEEWAEKLILPTTGKRYALIADASVDHILKKPKFFGVSKDIKTKMRGTDIPEKDIEAIPTYPASSSENNTMNFDKHTDKTKQQTAFNRNKKDGRNIAAIIRKQKLHRRT